MVIEPVTAAADDAADEAGALDAAADELLGAGALVGAGAAVGEAHATIKASIATSAINTIFFISSPPVK